MNNISTVSLQTIAVEQLFPPEVWSIVLGYELEAPAAGLIRSWAKKSLKKELREIQAEIQQLPWIPKTLSPTVSEKEQMITRMWKVRKLANRCREYRQIETSLTALDWLYSNIVLYGTWGFDSQRVVEIRGLMGIEHSILRGKDRNSILVLDFGADSPVHSLEQKKSLVEYIKTDLNCPNVERIGLFNQHRWTDLSHHFPRLQGLDLFAPQTGTFPFPPLEKGKFSLLQCYSDCCPVGLPSLEEGEWIAHPADEMILIAEQKSLKRKLDILYEVERLRRLCLQIQDNFNLLNVSQLCVSSRAFKKCMELFCMPPDKVFLPESENLSEENDRLLLDSLSLSQESFDDELNTCICEAVLST